MPGLLQDTPWISVNPNYETINAETEEGDPRSVLNYFKKLVALRKSEPTLVYGQYELLDKDNPDVYSYTRTEQGRKILIMLNFTSHDAQAHTGLDISDKKVLIGNYETASRSGKLRPYEAVVVALQ